MTDFAKVRKSLEDRGYAVREFASAAEAAAYLNEAIDGKHRGLRRLRNTGRHGHL